MNNLHTFNLPWRYANIPLLTKETFEELLTNHISIMPQGELLDYWEEERTFSGLWRYAWEADGRMFIIDLPDHRHQNVLDDQRMMAYFQEVRNMYTPSYTYYGQPNRWTITERNVATLSRTSEKMYKRAIEEELDTNNLPDIYTKVCVEQGHNWEHVGEWRYCTRCDYEEQDPDWDGDYDDEDNN